MGFLDGECKKRQLENVARLGTATPTESSMSNVLTYFSGCKHSLERRLSMALVWQVYLSIVTLRSSHWYAQWLVSAEVVWWIDSKIQWWSLGEAPQGVSSLVCFGCSRQKEGFNQQNSWIYITNWPQRPNVMRLKSFAICMLRKFDRSCVLETISILLHFAGLKFQKHFGKFKLRKPLTGPSKNWTIGFDPSWNRRKPFVFGANNIKQLLVA